MGDYEELRDEMQYYENEHYNELRKLEAEENASPTLKADRDAWEARAERAEAKIKELALKLIKKNNQIIANIEKSITEIKLSAEYLARAEKAEAELKEAVEEVERQIHCRGIYGCSDCANSLCYYKGGNQPCKPNWRGQEGSK